VGRSHDPHGQRRPGVDGVQDVRFRRRRADVWEPEEDIYWGLKASGWRMSATAATGIFKIPSLPCRWA